jgi:hypothetical protein
MRQPAAMLLSNLGSSFCDLARACAARSAGRSSEEMAKDFSYRFPWRAKKCV